MKSWRPRRVPGSRHQATADAEVPGVGIDIEAEQLAPVRESTSRAGSGGGETADDAVFHGHQGRRRVGVGRAEGVAGHAVLGPQPVEIVVGEESPVGRLPGPDVDSGHGGGVGWCGGADDQHRIIFDD